MNARLTFVHALSSLHAGVGQGSGVIDLPIAREKATSIPFLPGSSLKGALRTRSRTTSDDRIAASIFGSDDEQDEHSTASLIQITDQRLLLLPVRSLAGTFAWVTSPFILTRLLRDCQDLSLLGSAVGIPKPKDMESCLLPTDKSSLVFEPQQAQKVYLEELDLPAQVSTEFAQWADWLGQRLFPGQELWRTLLKERLCLVHDDLFSFLLTTATEITARIRLQEGSKTVTRGGLWYEEALPAESILSGIVMATPLKKIALKPEEIMQHIITLTATPIQLGGKATVGRGLCRVTLVGKDN